jgi:hypothetical protein
MEREASDACGTIQDGTERCTFWWPLRDASNRANGECLSALWIINRLLWSFKIEIGRGKLYRISSHKNDLTSFHASEPACMQDRAGQGKAVQDRAGLSCFSLMQLLLGLHTTTLYSLSLDWPNVQQRHVMRIYDPGTRRDGDIVSSHVIHFFSI